MLVNIPYMEHLGDVTTKSPTLNELSLRELAAVPAISGLIGADHFPIYDAYKHSMAISIDNHW